MKPANEMLPKEIIDAKNLSGCAFIPVSPEFEWHSFHLPVGCDGIIAEEVSRLTAERIGGIFFRTLSFGLDEWRDSEHLERWGLNQDSNVFGMRFPKLPLYSEYSEKMEMGKTIINRIEALRESGFRSIFLVNHHGGRGQIEFLQEIAEKETNETCLVDLIYINRFNSVKNHRYLSVGGHAGLAETALLSAFRPDLVDLTQIPDGELRVSEYGILHNSPIIEEEWNPRHIVISIANALRHSIIDNLTDYIKKRLL